MKLRNKFLKKAIVVMFLLIHTVEIFATNLILDPNSKHNTKLDKSETGVPIVNVSTPNNRGISVNEFLDYNVGKEGQVLNNADNTGRSHIAGLVNANPNLAANQAANLIVLQVNGSNRSQIEGYLEALSREKVNVILSNENGLYINDAGTINIKNFTATTGKVKLKDGDFIGIDVNKGHVAIGPKGLDVTNTNYVEILSKTLELTGNLVSSGDVKVVTGSNKVDKNGNIEKNNSTTAASIAIDASNLGGMYANTIKIISTDKGAGVNSDAFIVSKNNKLEITADGKIKVNKVQGKGIEVKGNEYEQKGFAHSDLDINIKADNIKLNGAGTQAEQKIILDGNVDNNSVIYTKESLKTKDLKNTSNIQVLKDIQVDGKLISSGDIQADDKILVASSADNTGSISTGSTFSAKDTKTKGKLIAKDNIDVKNFTNEGIVVTEAKLNIDGSLKNTGEIKVIDSILVTSNTDNTGEILTNSTFTAKDTKTTNKLIAVKDIKVDNLENSGIVATENKLNIEGNLKNAATIQAEKDIEVKGNANNSGDILTNSSFIAKDLNNSKRLIANKNIDIKALDNSGAIGAGEDLKVNGSFKNIKTVEATNISVIGNSLDNTGDVKAENISAKVNNLKNDGEILALNDINLETSKLENSKKIAAVRNISSNNTKVINSGEILSNGEILLNNSDITNTNKILSNKIEIKDTKSFNNTGIISGNDVALTTKKDLNLVGELHGETKLVIEGKNIINDGKTTGKGSISINSNDFINKKELSTGELKINATGNVENNSILNARNINIDGKNVTNNDLIAAENNLKITVKEKVVNNKEKTLYAGGNLNVDAKEILNNSGEIFGKDLLLKADYVKNETGVLQALNNIHIKTKKFENIGKVTNLDKYESYYETWDGKIIEANQISDWKRHFSRGASRRSNGSAGDYVRGKQREAFEEISGRMSNDKYASLLFPKYTELMRGYLGNRAEYTEHTGSARIQTVPLKEKLRSLGQTTHAKVLAGNNIIIESDNGGKADEVINKDGIISAGNTVKIDANKVANIVSVGDEKIKVKTGQETMFIKFERTGKRPRKKVRMEVTYTRDFAQDYKPVKVFKFDENGKPIMKSGFGRRKEQEYDIVMEYKGRYAYVTGQPSIIEGKNVIIDNSSLVIQGIEEANGLIKNKTVGGKLEDININIDKGISKINPNLTISSDMSNKAVLDTKTEVVGNIKAIEDIIKTGKIDTLPSLPSALFIKNVDPSSKYIMETRAKYINLSSYYGSDYFLTRIGYEEKWDRVRRLGDAFYENQLVDKTIVEKLGSRFIDGKALSMKDLIDNAGDEAKKLNLTVGKPLTKEEISKLDKNIVWYEYQEVNGEKVLAPKIYLTKNTIENLSSDSRSKIGGTELTYIKAEELENQGAKLGNTGITYVEANSITNSTLTNQLGEITGTKTYLIADKDIKNIGGKIFGEEELSLVSKNGDILNQSTVSSTNREFDELNRTRHTEIKSVAEISTNDKLKISANNYTSIAGITNAKNLEIDVKEDVNIISQKLSGEQKYGKDGDNFNSYAFESNIGSNINAENIDISAKNLNIKGSNLVAQKDLNILAKEDINIISNTGNVYTESRSKEKGNFSKKSSININYSTQNVASNIIGNNINIESGKDVAILGSNIQAGVEGEANIKAQGDIIQAGVKDISYSYYKKSKSSLGGLISKSTTVESYKEDAIKSAAISGNKGLVYDSKNDLVLEGVNVVSSGSIKLKGNNVIVNPIETEEYTKIKKEKKGFTGSLTPTSISVSYGKDKFSSDTTNKTQHSSEITSAQSIDIEASDKVKAKSVNIYANEDINISGDKGVEISTANNSYENITKQSSSRIGASVGINSAIVNTVENVKDIKNLTDFSGNSYDILNNASKVVGAIKDGAKATIAIADTSYKGATDAGFDKLKIMNDVFKANISYNKSKSKSSVHNETVEKSSLVSGNNMNIKSKNGSITISGTDVKVGNDLDLNAKKDITIKASEENYTSSNSSSQMGIGLSADLSKGKIADLSISKAGTKGRGNGTNYVNSIIDVDGKLKTNSENLTISGANVEADNLDIKAKNLIIESKQDKSERKDSSYGGSFSIDLANPSNFSANINGSKGNGEKEWVNKQTSLIARNGGKVDTDTLTNTGAIIGSESSDNKLKISANKITVNDLEDKNKYENKGGGITIGTDIPNILVKHDKVDKEQINRATAINTDFEISGKKTSAEDLGFNTDISKAQEKTKDEEKHLDAELHTDLLGKDKQEELKKAGEIIGDLSTALVNKGETEGDFLERYKQASMISAIGDQVEKNPEYLSILEKETIKNGKIDDDVQVEQVSVMNKLLNDALRAKGYAGPDIKMVLTDVTDPIGPYYTDTLTNTVVFDRKMLASANRDEILNALGHEFGHYSKEDDIDKSQDIANHTGKLLEDRTKDIVSKEATEDTLAAIRNNKNVITGEEGRLLAESIPMDRREYESYILERSLDIPVIGQFGAHTTIPIFPNIQADFFEKDGTTKEEFKFLGEPIELKNGKKGWVIGAFKGDKNKGEESNKLIFRVNDLSDVKALKYEKDGEKTGIKGNKIKELTSDIENDTEAIKHIIKMYKNYTENQEYLNYSAFPMIRKNCGNCHSMSYTIAEKILGKSITGYGNLPNQRGKNIIENIETKRLNPGSEIRIFYEKFESKNGDKK